MRSSAISGSRQNRQAQIFLLNHSDNQNPKITFFLSLFTDPQPSQHTLQRGTFFTCSKSDYCVILRDTRFWHETKKNKKKHQCNFNSEVEWHDVACCMLWPDICVCAHAHNVRMCVCVGCISPSTHAGRARVVPAICPLRQAQRAVCLAIVRLGWLLSLFNITISHVPTANWPVEETHTHTFQKAWLWK